MDNSLIKRQDAIDAVNTALFPKINTAKDAEKALKALPFAEPERKTGKWERRNTYHGDDTSGFVDPDWRCSECGGQANVNVWSMYDLTDFCPHCGVDMRKEE